MTQAQAITKLQVDLAALTGVVTTLKAQVAVMAAPAPVQAELLLPVAGEITAGITAELDANGYIRVIVTR